MTRSNPIYIIENQVYRFEQTIGNYIELFNGKTQTSVLIDTNVFSEDMIDQDELNRAIKNKQYTIIQY